MIKLNLKIRIRSRDKSIQQGPETGEKELTRFGERHQWTRAH